MTLNFFLFTDFDIHLFINRFRVLTSIYYPWHYLNNMDQRWHLETLRSQRIHLKFLYLNTEREPTCKNDYIVIDDGDSRWRKQFYICGKIVPVEFKSSSNKLLIRFKSNHKISQTGFKIQCSIVGGKRTMVLTAHASFLLLIMNIFFYQQKTRTIAVCWLTYQVYNLMFTFGKGNLRYQNLYSRLH